MINFFGKMKMGMGSQRWDNQTWRSWVKAHRDKDEFSGDEVKRRWWWGKKMGCNLSFKKKRKKCGVI